MIPDISTHVRLDFLVAAKELRGKFNAGLREIYDIPMAFLETWVWRPERKTGTERNDTEKRSSLTERDNGRGGTVPVNSWINRFSFIITIIIILG